MRWRRALRHLGIIVVGTVTVGGLLVWLADVPAQYPDHGLAAVQDTEDSDVVAAVACLIEEVRLDPAAFGVGGDFEILPGDSDPTTMIVHGWLRRTSVSWLDNRLSVRTNPLSDADLIPTNCPAPETEQLEAG